MRVVLEFVGHDFEQFVLYRNDIFSRREAGAIRDAKDMRVDCDGRLSERDIEDDIGGFAADTRQSFKILACGGYRSRVTREQKFAGRHDIFGLGAVEPDALDVGFESGRAELQDSRRRVRHLGGRQDVENGPR